MDSRSQARLKEKEKVIDQVAMAIQRGLEEPDPDYQLRAPARNAMRAIHDELSKLVVQGPLKGNGCDETAQRNGIILACNHLFFLQTEGGSTNHLPE